MLKLWLTASVIVSSDKPPDRICLAKTLLGISNDGFTPKQSSVIWPDKFVPDMQLCSGRFKQGWQVLFRRGKTVGELKAVVGLDTFHTHATASKPFNRFLQKVSGRIGALFPISGKKAQAGIFVYGGVLIWQRNSRSTPTNFSRRLKNTRKSRNWMPKSYGS